MWFLRGGTLRKLGRQQKEQQMQRLQSNVCPIHLLKPRKGCHQFYWQSSLYELLQFENIVYLLCEGGVTGASSTLLGNSTYEEVQPLLLGSLEPLDFLYLLPGHEGRGEHYSWGCCQPVQYLCQFPKGAVTKCHKHKRNVFPYSSEAGSPKSRCWQQWFLWKALRRNVS